MLSRTSSALVVIAMLATTLAFGAVTLGAQTCTNVTQWGVELNGASVSPQTNIFLDGAGNPSIDLDPTTRRTATNNVFYVDDDASPGGNGTSPTSAFDNIEIALDTIRATGVSAATVNVAAGSYTYGETNNQGFALNLIGQGPGQTIINHGAGQNFNARMRDFDTYVQGVTFEGGARNVDARYMTRLTFVDTEFRNATGNDSVQTVNVNDIVIMNSTATGSNDDGFSYTMSNGESASVLEAFVNSSGNGGGGIWSMQGSTVHEKVSVVRVGGTYTNNPTNLGDIGSGTNWNIGVTAANASLEEGGEYRNLYASENTVNWIIAGDFSQGPGNTVVRANSNAEIRYVSEFGTLCLLYTSPSPRDRTRSRMPSSA